MTTSIGIIIGMLICNLFLFGILFYLKQTSPFPSDRPLPHLFVDNKNVITTDKLNKWNGDLIRSVNSGGN